MAETIRHRRLRQKKISLYQMGYDYLCANFSKFKESNKIKVALAILQIEKAKPLIDQSQHTHFTYVFDDGKSKENRNPLQPTAVPERDPRL